MDAQDLIACWEQGRRRHPLDRALLLHAAAAPDQDPDTLADRTLGERNAALLRLRKSLFGDELKSCVACPECSEKLEFALSADALLGASNAESGATAAHICIAGRRVRVPTTRDLVAVALEPDSATAARMLLSRICDFDVCAIDADSEPAVEELSLTLEAADPCMDFTIELTCPACAHRWNAAFDTPEFLWEEIEVHARHLLDEVHVLASTYGWDEAQILRLPQTRRRAYVTRVLA